MLQRLVTTICLIVMAWSLSHAMGKPRLGYVKFKEVTCVTLNEQGVPVIGGEEELRLDDAYPDSCTLKIRINEGGKVTTRLLVYNIGEKSEPFILVKEPQGPNDPNVGYYWKQQEHIPEHVRDDTNPIRTHTRYYPTRGPFTNHWLSSDKDKRLMLRDKNTEGESGGFVGVIRGYDNLNDGK